ncbi:MAG: S-adenosylmethionine synthetase N-terminal domain-containing protein, partial [Eubacteriales bacterium]|nr:S-adenosylmethionine synthetase N-terminal domain-containing protein [Eubacteriales bacterium]
MSHYFFTSEAVCEGHPDKICDQIADAILDEILRQDPRARVACEVTADPKFLHIMGEVSSTAVVDYEAIARSVIREIGYDDPSLGFSDQSEIIVTMKEQSPDIAMGVCREREEEQGAGDQGIMFGYASNETEVAMPLAISLAQRLMEELSRQRKSGALAYLRPDGKGQVTVEYLDGRALRVDAVVLSAQHDAEIDMARLR